MFRDAGRIARLEVLLIALGPDTAKSALTTGLFFAVPFLSTGMIFEAQHGVSRVGGFDVFVALPFGNFNFKLKELDIFVRYGSHWPIPKAQTSWEGRRLSTNCATIRQLCSTTLTLEWRPKWGNLKTD